MRKAKQLTFPRTRGWGGRRRDAGRKNKSGTVNHMARAKVCAHWPMHITMRLQPGMPTLRRRNFLHAFAVAAKAIKKHGFKVNQFSILGNHLHLIAEVSDNRELSRGMQSLSIRLAKSIKRIARLELKRPVRGAVFRGRYHLHILKSPHEMRNALKYVLLNEARHGKRKPSLTVFSSGGEFTHWGRLDISVLPKDLKVYREFWSGLFPIKGALTDPTSWLGRVGWMRLADPAGI